MPHTINVPLARQVLAQLHAAPRRWTQNLWLNRPYPEAAQAPTDTVDNCRTSGCFAGWTAVLAGYKTDSLGRLTAEAIPAPVRDHIARTFDLPHDPQYCGWGSEYGWMRRSYGARVYGVKHVAAAELGLTDEQAGALFDGNNTLRRIYELLSEFTDGEIEVPADLPDWANIDPDDLGMYWEDLDAAAESTT